MPAIAPQTNNPLWEMDRAHTLHPWTNFGPFKQNGALVITRGAGAYLWDSDRPPDWSFESHVAAADHL